MGHRITVWIFELDRAAEELATIETWLSDDERQRCSGLLRARDRSRFTAAHGIMRRILGQAIGREAEAVSFARNAYGKPALKGHERLGFNLSHSEGLGVLAVADGVPLGVDVEKLAPIEPTVAEISFSRAERAELAACEEDQWLASFYRHWTRKEAIIKALGLGLAEAPDLDDITPEAGTEPRLLHLKGAPETPPLWELFHFVPAAGYMGALAAPGSGHAIALKRWSPSAR